MLVAGDQSTTLEVTLFALSTIYLWSYWECRSSHSHLFPTHEKKNKNMKMYGFGDSGQNPVLHWTINVNLVDIHYMVPNKAKSLKFDEGPKCI